MIMFVTSILFTVLLLVAAWAAGGILYRIRTYNLIREARRLRRYNKIMGRTTPERAESEQDDGN